MLQQRILSFDFLYLFFITLICVGVIYQEKYFQNEVSQELRK